MKGTVFMEEPEFAAELNLALQRDYHAVLQEEIPVRPHVLSFFNEKGQVDTGTWYFRVTVHFHYHELADIISHRPAGQTGARRAGLFAAGHDH